MASSPAPTASRKPETEKQFTQAVIDLARACGWLAYHTHDSRHSAPGFPDLTMVRGDRLVFAELKTEKGRVTHAQAHWLGALSEIVDEAEGDAQALENEFGGPLTRRIAVYLWRPSDWDEIVRVLR